MQKLFITDELITDKIILTHDQSRHIAKSLRMKTGDMLMVCDGAGTDYGCMIDEITKDSVVLSVCYKQASKSEPSVQVSLYQGVPKGDKMEDIIQKCTELGISRITPVLTKRSVSRPNEKQAEKKRARYQKIALEAAQQSGRGIVPEIGSMTGFKEAVKNCTADVKIVFYEGGGKSIKSIVEQNKNASSFAIFIGPEGGFEKEEVDEILNYGGINATLGARILRTQTAPVAGLTAIMLLTGNLE